MSAIALRARSAVEDVGEWARIGARSVLTTVRRPRVFHDIVVQLDGLMVRSFGVAALTAVCSALVMTVQFGLQLGRFGAKAYIGNVVALSLVREIGPVLTALLVGGRIGSGIAAELGSMHVTEQVDALRAMGADPIEKLVVPRVIAGAIALPLLTVLADALGVLASVFMASFDTHMDLAYFYSSITRTVAISDVMGGLLKAFVFGLLITMIACQRGLRVRGGTEGVGRGTKETVVVASIAVVIADFIITSVLMAFGM